MTKISLADMRKSYQSAELLEENAQNHPMRQFEQWLHEALQAEVAPPVVLESTHEKALKYVSLAQLREFAWAPH